MRDLECIIIDDQKKSRELLQYHLKERCPHIQVLDQFDNPMSGADYLNSHRVDLVFLDVEMGSMTGFDLFQHLQNKEELPLIIFVTAHSGYAIEAIKSDAFDYVLKPIDPEELVNTLKKAEERIEEINFQQKINATFFEKSSNQDQLQVLVSGGVEFIKKNDIIYLKASRNYTEFYLKGGRQIVASNPLTYFEQAINDPYFVRSHRSYVVNMKEIRAFRTADGGYLELTENHRANITSANKDILMSKMGEL